MNDVNNIINECGLSKVSVAKYIGVSRQMLYNYLALTDINDIPKDKQNRLLSLLGVEDVKELSKIKIDDTYISTLQNRLNEGLIESFSRESIADLKGLSKKDQELLSDIFNILKEKVSSDNSEVGHKTLEYIHDYLQSMEQVEELKYILAYFAKSNGKIGPLDFVYDEDRQYIFEGILYSAMTLYTNGGASKSKVAESHKKFEEEIASKNEEKLSRTQELNSFKVQALNELGYSSINESNAKEVFEKIAEIMSRKF